MTHHHGTCVQCRWYEARDCHHGESPRPLDYSARWWCHLWEPPAGRCCESCAWQDRARTMADDVETLYRCRVRNGYRHDGDTCPAWRCRVTP